MKNSLFTITIAATLFGPSAFACSMTPLGLSTTVLTAVSEQVARDAEPADWGNEVIRVELVRGFEAHVHLRTEENRCRIVRYHVELAPDCATTVSFLGSRPADCR